MDRLLWFNTFVSVWCFSFAFRYTITGRVEPAIVIGLLGIANLVMVLYPLWKKKTLEKQKMMALFKTD